MNKNLTQAQISNLADVVEHERLMFNSYSQDESQYRKDAKDLFSLRKVVIGLYQIEVWWDCHSRNWITQVKSTVTGYDLDDTQYDGNKDDAAVAFAWAIIKYTQRSMNE